jgi:hypothetical protein
LFEFGGEWVIVEGEVAAGEGAEGGGEIFELLGVGVDAGLGRAGGGLVDEQRADGEGERNVLWWEVAFCGVWVCGVGLGGEAFLRSWVQVSKWSTQPWMVKVQGPSLSTVKVACQRSLGRAVMGADCHSRSWAGL